MIRPGVGRIGLSLILALGAGACGGAEPGSEAVAADTPTAVVADTSPVLPEAEDPFRGFDIDRAGEPRTERTIALRLRNDGPEDVAVYADGGAGEVFLDSVAARGWSRVDLVSVGPEVTLRTALPSGEATHRLVLDMVPDSIFEVSVGEPSAKP